MDLTNKILAPSVTSDGRVGPNRWQNAEGAFSDFLRNLSTGHAPSDVMTKTKEIARYVELLDGDEFYRNQERRAISNEQLEIGRALLPLQRQRHGITSGTVVDGEYGPVVISTVVGGVSVVGTPDTSDWFANATIKKTTDGWEVRDSLVNDRKIITFEFHCDALAYAQGALANRYGQHGNRSTLGDFNAPFVKIMSDPDLKAAAVAALDTDIKPMSDRLDALKLNLSALDPESATEVTTVEGPYGTLSAVTVLDKFAYDYAFGTGEVLRVRTVGTKDDFIAYQRNDGLFEHVGVGMVPEDEMIMIEKLRDYAVREAFAE
jgi:hypothetical protein